MTLNWINVLIGANSAGLIDGWNNGENDHPNDDTRVDQIVRMIAGKWLEWRPKQRQEWPSEDGGNEDRNDSWKVGRKDDLLLDVDAFLLYRGPNGDDTVLLLLHIDGDDA